MLACRLLLFAFTTGTKLVWFPTALMPYTYAAVRIGVTGTAG
jgi:hypothetical protein